MELTRHKPIVGLAALAIFAVAGWRVCAQSLSNDSISEAPITDSDRAHWAFEPLSKAAPPVVNDAAWVRNTIDRFVLARLEENGLRPLPPTDRVTLIRRVTFDLTGLPPTPPEVDAFVQDSSPDAYEHLIDRLLASHHYGKRWAQHWLDLARFAETDGFEQDKLRPNAWRYRDWVIDALNRDVPYDAFVRLQIAGDELKPGDPDAAVATGFALCGPDMTDINLIQERRHMVLNDATATVGAVFLGLQIGCAQCHDHKFDPISQHDFYRLRAFFEPAEMFRDHPIPTAQERREHQQAKEELTRQRRKLETDIAGLPQGPSERRTALTAALNQLEKKKAPSLPAGRVLREKSAEAQPAYLMIRGDFRRTGPRIEAAFPRIANAPGTEPQIPPERDNTSGLRTALAQWLTQPDHPLATRVIVNRVWQHHFGQGLVRSPSDFGRRGEKPTHPALLDWLAAEFPRRGWSLKRLHKRIVLSATYRQPSRPDAPHWTPAQREAAATSWKRSLQADPDNRLLARFSRRRLDAESIRDALLAVSGRLSPRRGGPGVMPPLPREIRNQVRKDHWKVSPDEEDHRRRSIYLFVRRNLRYPLFEVFDRPDTNASCPQRSRSTIAPQALALLNSELSLDAARHLAGLVLGRAGDDRTRQVDLAYRHALGRHPMPEETAAATAFLAQQASGLRRERRDGRDDFALPEPWTGNADPHHAAALTGLCLSLLNLNEFLYID